MHPQCFQGKLHSYFVQDKLYTNGTKNKPLVAMSDYVQAKESNLCKFIQGNSFCCFGLLSWHDTHCR